MYNIYSLKNGLKVVTEKITYVNSVSVGVWFKVGSRNETMNDNGISHFIEHMLFKGTKNRSAVDIVKEIEDVGGQVNAFTGKEVTCFYVRLLNTHEKLAIDVLADMIFNSLFYDEDIAKEKSVVNEEINMNEDSPEDILSDLSSKSIWGSSGLANSILGTKANIRDFNREQIIQYIKENYIPKNCVISVCGNFSSDIYNYIEENFSAWENHSNEERVFDVPEKTNTNIFKLKDIEQLHINMSLDGVALNEDNTFALALLANRFGGGASSVLFQKVREERGLCYTVYGYTNAYINTGAFNIYGALSQSTVNEFLDITKNEIEKFAKYNFSHDELYKAKEQLKGAYLLGLENTSARMFTLGRNLLLRNKIKTPDEILSEIEAIDVERLQHFQNEVFNKGILSYSIVGNDITGINVPNIREVQ